MASLKWHRVPGQLGTYRTADGAWQVAGERTTWTLTMLDDGAIAEDHPGSPFRSKTLAQRAAEATERKADADDAQEYAERTVQRTRATPPAGSLDERLSQLDTHLCSLHLMVGQLAGACQNMASAVDRLTKQLRKGPE